MSPTAQPRSRLPGGLAGWPLLLALALGCAAPSPYVSENADFSLIRSVAILPFDDASGEKMGAERIQRIFMTELLALGVFDPVEPGQVVRAVRTERIDPASFTPDDIKKLGKLLGVQGVFVGSIIEYSEGRSASQSAQVTLQIRLLDVESGKTVWSTSRSGTGATVTGRLFGMGSLTASEVARQLIREELERLVR